MDPLSPVQEHGQARAKASFEAPPAGSARHPALADVGQAIGWRPRDGGSLCSRFFIGASFPVQDLDQIAAGWRARQPRAGEVTR